MSDHPLEIVSFTKEEDPIRHTSTGFETITIAMLNILVQSSAGYDPVSLITTETDYGSLTELESASPTTFVEKNEGGNPTLMQIVLDLKAQSRTYFAVLNKDVDGFPDLSSSGILMQAFEPDVRAGLLDRRHNRTGEDLSTVASTIENIIKGINWKDDSASTYEKHETMLRRLYYVFALNYTDEFPPLGANISSNTQITANKQRMIDIYLAAITNDIFYFFVGAYLQSDRGAFNLGFLEYEDLRKSTPETMRKDVNAKWVEFMKSDKIGLIAAASGNGYHGSYIANYINVSQIDEGDWDTTFGKIDRYNFKFPLKVLELVRQIFGVGVYDGNHFALLMNGVKPTSSGDYDGQGSSEWAVGIQTVLMFKLLKDDKNWYKEMIGAVKQSVHYTFKDISKAFDNYAIDFNIITSLEGIAEPEAYWALRRNFAYSDSNMNVPLETEVVRDPQSCHSSSVLKDGIQNFAGVPMFQYIFLQGMFDDDYSLICARDITLKHLKINLMLEMLMCLTSSTSWQNTRYSTSYIRLVEMVSTKTNELRTLVGINTSSSGQSQQPRWEHILDPQDYTNYPTIALHYMVGLCKNGIQSRVHNISYPRPHDWYERRTHFIHFFSDDGLLRNFARILFSNQHIKFSDKAIPAPKATVIDPKTDTDEDVVD